MKTKSDPHVYVHAKHWNNIFKEEFAKESDRASVILSVAMLDEALATLLRSRLIAVTSADDSLLDGAYAPISSFSARVDLAYRVGLISVQFCRDLHIIRRIRNEFAHNVSGCSFDSATIRSRVIELSRSCKAIIEGEVRKSFPDGIKGDFQILVSWMLWNLWCNTETVEKIESKSPEFGYLELTDKEESPEKGES